MLPLVKDEFDITVLYPDEGQDVGTNRNLGLDIVAVHGLNGNCFRTWTEPKSQKLWLRDFLPTDLEKARIMTFGYNAAAAFHSSVARIEDHARDLLRCLKAKREDREALKRPLIFVGHSLGGLVIKEALIIASRQDYFRQIFESTRGVIFFGTPHQGSSFADVGKSVARIPSILAMKPDSELLGALKKGNEALTKLNQTFLDTLESGAKAYQIQIVSFYETRAMKYVRKLIVHETSAVLTRPGVVLSYENTIPVDATHRDMCRFADKNKTYKAFVSSVKDILRSGNVAVKNEHYLVPRTVSENFTGRKDVLQKMHKSLIEDRLMDTNALRRFVMYGLGGSGKTQTCLAFAHEYRDSFWGIFWIDASTAETASAGFAAIAAEFKQKESIDSVKDWLSGKDNWLLIIDNADDPKIDITGYFPSGTRGAILVTTRNAENEVHARNGSHRLEEMNTNDAINLLLKLANVENPETTAVRESAEKVVKTLGCLALAIVQAGAVIRQKICSLNGFCNLYAQHKELLEAARPALASDYHSSLFNTYEITIDRLMKADDEPTKLALDLLAVFAFMHFADIKEEIFNRARTELYLYPGFKREPEERKQQIPFARSPIEIAKALSVLAKFSLINIDDARRITIHPLFHEWSRDRLSMHDLQTWRSTALSLLAWSMPWGSSLADKNYRRSLIAHLDTCYRYEDRHNLIESSPDVLCRIGLVSKLEFVYREHLRFEEALGLSDLTLSVLRESLSEEHPIVLEFMGHNAHSLSGLYRFEAAYALRLQILHLAENSAGKNNAMTIQAKLAFASALYDLGRLDEWTDLCLEIAKTAKESFGEKHHYTLTAMAALATALTFKGRWSTAVSIGEFVANETEAVYGVDDIRTIGTLSSLCYYYEGAGNNKKAHALIMQSLAKIGTMAKDETTLDEQTLIHWQLSMAETAHPAMFRSFKTVKLQSALIEKMKDVLGETHPGTLTHMAKLADTHIQRGFLLKALDLYEAVVAGMVKTYGPDHPTTLDYAKSLRDTHVSIWWADIFQRWIPPFMRGMVHRGGNFTNGRSQPTKFNRIR